MFKTIQKVHFVGIGGSGMSGIAEVLLNLNYQVSGSDLKETEVTERLKSLGATIYYGHQEKNVGSAQVVVTSTAVQSANPEVVFAHRNKISVIPRIEMLSEIARLKYTIAVAGTHGKTTTTSMVASVLQEAGMDPTFIVGGKIRHLQTGAQLGHGEFLVAEADESDGSFLKLSPTLSIITNIDNDHLDYYKSMQNLRQAFIEFANHVPFYGCTIACIDNEEVRAVLPSISRRVVTYGLNSSADYSAQDILFDENGSQFTLLEEKKIIGRIILKLSGKHNVQNALAACACALQLNIPFEKIVLALQKFESVARRLEIKGAKNGAIWIDDYGHHPTEIKAVLSAIRSRYPNKKLIVLFQPHRYSRTKILMKEFSKSFQDADEVVLLPIYPAGEKPIAGVKSDKLLPLIKKSGIKASLGNGHNPNLKEYLRPENIVLTLGAGDIWKVGESLFRD